MASDTSRDPCCGPDCCPARPEVRARPLLNSSDALELAEVFKVLANDTRLRLLHALARKDELSVTALADSVGMKPQAVSNQLQKLHDLGVLAFRRDGTTILYRIIDPCVLSLLDTGLCLMEEARRRTKGGRRVNVLT